MLHIAAAVLINTTARGDYWKLARSRTMQSGKLPLCTTAIAEVEAFPENKTSFFTTGFHTKNNRPIQFTDQFLSKY